MKFTFFSAICTASLYVLFFAPQSVSAQVKSIDSYTQTALDADKRAKELYQPVQTLESSFQKKVDKKTKYALVEAYMKFGNYMMLESPVSPRSKYRPALKAYNRVLELDKSNEEAAKNKKQIEDIYTQMGMPIPKD